MAGNLTTEAQARYGFIRDLLTRDTTPPARVVELGAAPGDQIVEFARLGYVATAVDIGDETSDAWGDGTEGRMEKLFAEAGVAFVRWNLEKTPYPLPDSSFEAVVMTEVYEHLRDYPARSLTEVRRILRPGGRLYFTTPNAAYVGNRVRLASGRSVATPLADWIGGVPHARHAREYTFGEVYELMERAGLKVIAATSRHFYLDSGRTTPLAVLAKRGLDLVGRLRPTLGPAIVVVAERPR